MNIDIQTDPWCISENEFHIVEQMASEGTYSIGNGSICQYANFEEYFSGKTTLGTCINGISFPNKIENKQVEENDKGINAPNWTGIIVRLNEEVLDLATWKVENYKRVLNMRNGFFERTFEAVSTKGHRIQVTAKRFLSMAETEIGAISYAVKSINFEGRVSFMPIIDGDLEDLFLNTNEPIWNVLQTMTQQDVAHLWIQIRRTDFHICTALTYILYKNNEQLKIIPTKIEKEKIAGFSIGTDIKSGDTISLNKFVAIVNSLNHSRKDITELACNLARAAKQKGWNKLFDEHTAVWTEKWINADIIIDGDIETLQANRYKTFREILGFENQKITFNS